MTDNYLNVFIVNPFTQSTSMSEKSSLVQIKSGVTSKLDWLIANDTQEFIGFRINEF